MKYKSKIKNGRLIIKAKIPSGLPINKQELDFFGRKILRGFFKTEQIKSGVLEFSGPIGISVSERLKRPINKYDFFFIIEQIVDNTQKLQKNNLPWNKVVWDINSSFINEATKELQLIYLPVSTANPDCGDVMTFIENIAYLSQPADEHDSDFVSRFVYFLRSINGFNPQKIEDYIKTEDRNVVNTIKKHRANSSGFITDKRRDYYDHYSNKSDDRDVSTEVIPENDDKDDSTGLLVEKCADIFSSKEYVATDFSAEEDATGLLVENGANTFSSKEYVATDFSAEEDATGLLVENGANTFTSKEYVATDFSAEEDATGLLTEEEYDGATGLLAEEDACEEDATGLLNESEAGSSVYGSYKAPHFPSLYRILTNETISVNKPVFRLGKEKSYVDYFVNNNNAVSRSHADIVTRGTKCFVVDLNSKNRTYINGQVLPVNCEVEITDGDHLKLGNEEFVFSV